MALDSSLPGPLQANYIASPLGRLNPNSEYLLSSYYVLDMAPHSCVNSINPSMGVYYPRFTGEKWRGIETLGKLANLTQLSGEDGIQTQEV